MNRIKQATQGEGGNGALPIYYKYNLSGQVTGVGYPKEDGDCVAAQGEGLQMMWYGYDGYGRISSVSYQKNGTLEAFESGIGYGKVTVREYLYTSGGELEKTVDYNRFDIDGSLVKNGARTVTEYVYDSAGRTVQTSYYNYAKGSAVGTLKEKHTITYDKNSGITGETIEDRYGSGLKTTEKRYVYDEAGRLTRAETDGEATEYTYDKVGNRLTQRKAGETLRYTYNGLNQLTKITKDGKQQAEYRYDGRGNQVYENRIYGEAVINGVTTPVYQTREYEFDLRNLLERAEVSTPSAVVGNVVEYEEVVTENRYDGSGQRIRREENGRETRFYYMGSGLLYTTAGDGTLVTENILGLNGGIIGSKRFSDPYGTPEEEYANRYYFYHYDIRGSVTNIVGDDGKLVKGYEYDEYGNTTDGGEESFINEVTFTGSVRDLGSGLQYMNARYYDPATGRFVSQDTYTGTPYAPWTQHLYSYCGNNPVNMVDPTGHMPIKPIAVCDGGSSNRFGYSNSYPGRYGTNQYDTQDIYYFNTMDDAASYWGNKYRHSSQDKEHGAMIYSTELEDGSTKYCTIETYPGAENDVIMGFIAGYLNGSMRYIDSRRYDLKGFTHTHPQPKFGHNDFPSYMDVLLLNMPNIEEVYVIPYKQCDDRGVIKVRDWDSWSHGGNLHFERLKEIFIENSPKLKFLTEIPGDTPLIGFFFRNPIGD